MSATLITQLADPNSATGEISFLIAKGLTIKSIKGKCLCFSVMDDEYATIKPSFKVDQIHSREFLSIIHNTKFAWHDGKYTIYCGSWNGWFKWKDVTMRKGKIVIA